MTLKQLLVRTIAFSALCGTSWLIVLNPLPSQAFLRVKGYVTAGVPNGIPNNSSFAAGDTLRFDFAINNYYASNINSNTINTWKPTSSLPLFEYLTISKCADLTVGCPNYTSILNTPWNNSTSSTDLQSFTVVPRNPSSWSNTTASDPGFTFNFSSSGSNGSTGATTTINGISNVPFTTITLGGSGFPGPIIVSLYDWYKINQLGGDFPSDFTAQNIVDNIKTSTGFITLSSSSTGVLNWDNLSGEMGGTLLNVNGIKLEGVPGPLPVAGCASAFCFSRKLRKRVAMANQSED